MMTLYRMSPMVKSFPTGLKGPTSLYPTVEVVIMVMYRQSIHFHFSMIRYPMVPADRRMKRESPARSRWARILERM